MARGGLRRIGGVVLAAAAIGLGIGVWQGGLVGGGASGGGCGGCTSTAMANIWVAQNGSDSSGSCTRSSSLIANPDTGGTSDCLTLSKAYQLASVGDTIGVGCGGGTTCSYGYQTIFWANAKSAGSTCQYGAPFPTSNVTQNLSGCIHYLPETGDTPTLSGMTINAPYVWIDSFTSTGGFTLFWDGNHGGGNCDQQKPNNEILSNDTFGGFYLGGVSQVYLINDNIGPTTDASNNIQPCDPASINNIGAYINTDHVAIIGGTIHDTTTSNPAGHIEGIHWQDTTYAYVARVKFTNNDQQDISFHPHSSNDHLDHMLIENNIFDRPCSNHGSPCGSIGAISWGCDFGTLKDVTVRFNSYYGGDIFDGLWNGGAAKCAAIASYGNILDGSNCPTQVSSFTVITYTYNIFTNSPTGCSGTNSAGNALSGIYVDPTYPAYNFTQKAGSPTVDFVPAGSVPAVPVIDIIGATRPDVVATSLDVGAYEKSNS
jgi:hypothetical protein